MAGMLQLIDWASRARDAWVGRCVCCAGIARSFACESCRRLPPLTWQLEGVPAWAAAPYAGPLGEHIRRLKYGDETQWAGPLGRLLRARLDHRILPQDITPECVLVPVPLHPARLAERGYNQAALIARAFGRASRLRVQTDLLVRATHTTAQATLDACSRRSNVSGAFALRKTPTSPVVLVDDVATTGSTLRECLLCLTRAGAIVRGVVTVALAGGTHQTP